jgi:hemoglobin-like flavoprotein
MATEIITTEDLQIFKNELLDDIKKLFNSKNDPTAKKWLKSYEVRQLLKI